MSESNTDHNTTIRPYDVLPDTAVRRITEAIFELMREIGIKFEPQPRALELLSQSGCDVSPEGIVKFPTELVRGCIDSVAKSVRVWDRPGTGFIEHSGQHTLFMPGMTCIYVMDLETGERRSSTRDDLATITRVADALPEIDAICLPCKIVERPDARGEIEEFAVMAANTTKPLTYLCNDPIALEAAIEIGAAIRGGRAQLRAKPYFFHDVTPLPLRYFRQHADQLFLAVDHGIPVSVGTASVGGASTPITVAGNVVNCFATQLAGLVLTQLIEEGSFCSVGSTISFMDPRTASLGAGPETLLAELAQCQIGRALGLTGVGGNAGLNLAKEFNQDAVSLIAVTMTMGVVSGAATGAYLGSIDADLTFSLHALLFCHELAGMSRRVWKGIRVDDETLALDVTRAVGVGGNYLAERHTATHCRTELWPNKYFKSIQFETWEREGKKDLKSRIDEELRRILETHQPEPMPGSIQSRIDTILEKFGVV